jgi:hypothetical protein
MDYERYNDEIIKIDKTLVVRGVALKKTKVYIKAFHLAKIHHFLSS